MKKSFLSILGPGLLFAGAAIGVSHLVQATKAGAEYGFGLVWALLIVHLFKYPFFKFGPKYAASTGESLLDGYLKLGKGYLMMYFFVNIVTMFTIQAAVTIVTASLATQLFGFSNNLVLWSTIILVALLIILIVGKYQLLDKLMKYIIVSLTISTLIAVFIAIYNNSASFSFVPFIPKEVAEISFLIAFLGWMPAPLDISIWHSLWSVEKNKSTTDKITVKKSVLDFNIGYIGTMILGLFFIILGALVMFNSNTELASSGSGFAIQLINLYTENLGDNFKLIIAIAAFTTMISTTITTLDASPRAMAKTTSLLFNNNSTLNYWFWLLFLTFGTFIILFFFLSNMILLVKIATIFSFLTAPIFALLNYKLITSKHTPKENHPNIFIKTLSYLGIIFLISFSGWYIFSIF
ncbi:Nramp family divalent metal transporter [Tenacibaculum sp. M341]|uniref:Nramp family divalent metal transporter n=1 Tax=Tenacibaculum sp. M341 TaxID=2530339 RepID=UPI00104FD4ED|nr:Nramp family divalent metal transporter [Tenacibaculum sp. M341]TCI94752.1 divalent metal cation transporter [Tenacibaculum sp. M341]